MEAHGVYSTVNNKDIKGSGSHTGRKKESQERASKSKSNSGASTKRKPPSEKPRKDKSPMGVHNVNVNVASPIYTNIAM